MLASTLAQPLASAPEMLAVAVFQGNKVTNTRHSFAWIHASRSKEKTIAYIDNIFDAR